MREFEDGDRRIRTWPSNELFDPFNPNPNLIRIDDIAHSLSLICRYNGHVPGHYSVGNHSINVANIVRRYGIEDKRVLQMALLHDSEEAYLMDMPKPYKHRYPKYVEDCDRLRNVIYDKYIPGWRTVDKAMSFVIHRADKEAYTVEKISFFNHRPELVEELPVIYKCRDPVDVRYEFLKMYWEYSNENI